jgi:REP element-mobilizing transposase RayT
MILNEYGQCALDEWAKTPELRPQIELDVFIVMPNHMHAILKINDNPGMSELNITNGDVLGELHSPNTSPRSPSQTVGAIVRGYKSSVTKQLGLMGFVGKLWQRNYYEHIIRNEDSYQSLSEYVINNPLKWTDDKFYMP